MLSALLYIWKYPNETLDIILVVTMCWHSLTEASQEEEQVLWETSEFWALSLKFMRNTQWISLDILVFTQSRICGCS